MNSGRGLEPVPAPAARLIRGGSEHADTRVAQAALTGESLRQKSGLPDRLPGRQAELFGVGPAVVLGEHLAEAARPVRDGAVTNLAARDRKAGNGHRKTAGS